MRNLVEFIRCSPVGTDSAIDQDRVSMLHQFAYARHKFAQAQYHARFMVDIGLNEQTLNIYDLIRIMEDNFRALGRAFYTGRPAHSPPQYAELSFNALTPNEEALLAKMWTKVNNATAPYYQGLTLTLT